MIVINANNVNHAFMQGLQLVLKHGGEVDASRNGAVIRVPEPVATVYAYPRRRVLRNPVRKANPFFHLMESLWMLAGRNDIKFVSYFNKRMAEYSDDGQTQPAAYGHRWRQHFGTDQISFVINELKTNPHSRRAVMTMADPVTDIDCVVQGGADVPCNTGIYFIVRADGRLDMTVTCRSNDAIWGCYGANVVHMSMLHEYVALSIGVPIGQYTQVSNDLHTYTDVFPFMKLVQMERVQLALYIPTPTSLWRSSESQTMFDADLETMFMYWDQGEPQEMINDAFVTNYFLWTVAPMFGAWWSYKNGNRAEALLYASKIFAEDWNAACSEWLIDTYNKKDRA